MAVCRLFLSIRFINKVARHQTRTLNGRLPWEIKDSDKILRSNRVSDNPRHLIFRRRQTNTTFFGWENQFFAILIWFLRSYGQTDLKIRFGVKFCSRYTYPEVCATENDAVQVSVRFNGVAKVSVAFYGWNLGNDWVKKLLGTAITYWENP